jgi:hypothetical protein
LKRNDLDVRIKKGNHMNQETSFKRITAIATILSAVLIVASTVTLIMAVNSNFEYLANPADLITAGLNSEAIGLFRWGSILEMFGSFLLLIPVTIYLRHWLKPHAPFMVDLATIFGLGAIILGVIGSAIRANFWPAMMTAYSTATEVQRPVLEIVFRSVTDFAFEGLYGLDSLLAGLWWLVIGLVLQAERRILGIATTVLGAAILGAGLGWLLQSYLLARLEMFYFLQPLWAIWLGIVIWLRSEQQEIAAEPAARLSPSSLR